MNKTFITIIVIIVLAAGGWFLYDHNKSNNSSSNSTNTSSAAQNKTSNNGSTNTNNQSAASAGAINIKNMMFTPPQISVSKGGTVTWTNNDTTAHTVTDDLSNVGGPDSGSIDPGSSYSFTFNKTGSFQYHCKFHTSMRGTIVVK